MVGGELMTLSAQDTEFVREIVKGVSGELKADIKGMKELFTIQDKNLCEKVEDVKKTLAENHEKHDKRICKIENSLSYYIGKAAGIALIVSVAASIFIAIIQVVIK